MAEFNPGLGIFAKEISKPVVEATKKLLKPMSEESPTGSMDIKGGTVPSFGAIPTPANIPNSAAPLAPPDMVERTKGGIVPPPVAPLTQSDTMKQIASSRSNELIPEGTIESQPRSAGTITTLAPQRNAFSGIIEPAGKTETVTRGGAGGISDHAKFLQDIESLVDKFGQKSMYTGGKVLPGEIVKAYTARIGMEGHKVAADAHKEAAADRDMLARERLDIMRQQIKQAEIAGQDTRALREKMHAEDIYQKDITTAGIDKNTGNFNRERGAFMLGNSGRHLENPEVQQAYIPFITKVKEWEKKNGRPMPPSQKRQWEIDYGKVKGWHE